MSRLKFVVPAAILTAGFLISTTTSFGKAAYTKETKKACSFCHVDAKKQPKELTDAGKYFKEHNNSLEGYQSSK